jgi:hypothetical protein
VASYPTTATSLAAQHATDAAFLETHKAEIILADTAIAAEFGVNGTATGAGSVLVVSSDHSTIRLGVEVVDQVNLNVTEA